MSIPGRRKWWQWLFPTYGNWGGPGWSAGCWNPAATDWECEAVGPMDKLFKAHDYAYQHNQDLDVADAKLVASLRRLKVTGVRERLYCNGAIVCFTVWPRIRSAYKGGIMKKVLFAFFVVALFILAVLLAWPLDMTFAVEVPPVTPVEFGGSASAHPIWSILAGQGFLGAILVGLGGMLYKLLRPYIVAYMKGKNIDRLYLAVEAFVAQVNAEYTEGMKKAHADGKLTKDEAEFVFSQCKQNLVIFMQSQGVDIIKEYGDAFVDALIEYIVSQIKNPLAKAVAIPLSGFSGSAPLPESVTSGALPG